MEKDNISICLNMIVKNESKIIIRLLESVYLLLDSYCICDTGSTDNTIELISNFFKEKKIVGKIIQEPFRDFGYNRTYALKYCNKNINSDYLLLLDADMIVIIDPINIPIFKKNLLHDVYLIKQGTSTLHYANVRLIKNKENYSYWGVTHEYVNPPENSTTGIINKNDFFILDIGDGGCKEDKIIRDIQLLLNGLKELPNNDRYTFYLANTYRDKGNYEIAIEYYKKRIQLQGWIEEIWYSNYMIGNCYKNINNMEKAIYYWLEAYNCFSCRIENLYQIIKYYRIQGKYLLANIFYNIANNERNKTNQWEYLFTELNVYNYKIDYELSIFGYYSNINNINLKQICMKILLQSELHDTVIKNVLSNYKFYSTPLINCMVPMMEDHYILLKSIGKELMEIHNNNNNNDNDMMISSTPTMCLGKNNRELIICVRYVNYNIDEKGYYNNKKNITTKNVVTVIDISSVLWIKTKESILMYNESYDNYYIGQEDFRIHRMEKKNEKKNTNDIYYHYNANRCILNGTMNIEHGEINIDSNENSFCEKSFIITNKNKDNKNILRSIEKNWVLFDDNGIEKCIYEWYPLTIGIIIKNEYIETKQSITPSFFKYVRGSSNGIIIKDEIWFLCHIVSYEDRRYYYHLIVVLDKKTIELKYFTNLFTFENKSVEYTLGMVLVDDTFLIGYSVMDNKSKYMTVKKTVFENMMINH